MLTQVVNGGNTYVYRYDGLGNRVARIENGVEKRYISGLLETDASGSITAYYVYGLGLISKITPSNEVYYYHYDGIGSTIGMSDSLGNIVNKYAYDAFGKVLNQEEVISNPFKYVGQFGVMDEENGLLYMRARYYDPDVGRFISKDPIGILGGLNMFTYVQNNPVNEIDPEGLQAVFLGSSTMIWARPTPFIRPGPWRLAPDQRYIPRVSPIPTPCPRPQPTFEPPPRIVKPQPKPLWYHLLRLLGKAEHAAGAGEGDLLNITTILDISDPSKPYDPVFNPGGFI